MLAEDRMSAAVKLTPREYLARERVAAFKSEFYRGEMFAMAGGSAAHSLIIANLIREVGVRLKGGPCRVYDSNLRVKVSTTGLYTYPDVTVVCEDAKFEDEVFDTLLNPRVLIEVLSDSTEKYDRGEKFKHYRNIASLQEYILVAQDEPLVESFVRQQNDTWLLRPHVGMESVLACSAIPVTVPLNEVYAGVALPPAGDGGHSVQTDSSPQG
jgi:Uma2 family endonuclease